ncbi:MAG: MFS transporter [Dehalococcoidia bacterium]|nr:MFS transporter [Dehalococcoidia bacterium]
MDEKTIGQATASPVAPATAEALAAEVTTTSVRGWAVIVLYRVQGSFSALPSLAFGMFLPFIREDLNMTSGQEGLLQSVIFGVSLGTGLFLSSFFSRFRPIPIIFASFLLVVPFAFLQGLANTFVVLLVIRVFFSAVSAPQQVAGTLLLQQWAARKDYTSVNAVAFFIHGAILATVLATATQIVDLVGSWRAAFYALAGLIALEGIIWRVLAVEKKAPVQRLQQSLQAANMPSPFLAVRRYPQIFTLAAFGFSLGLVWAGIITFVPTLMLQKGMVSVKWVGVMIACLYFGLTAASLLAGWIGRLVPNRKVLLTGLAVLNVGAGIGASMTGNLGLMIVFLLILGAVWGPFPLIQVFPFEWPGMTPREVTVVTAVLFTLMGVGFAVGPPIVGYIDDYTGSLEKALVILCAISGIGILGGLLYPARTGTSLTEKAKPTPAS